jgi:hypothetical protein
MENQRDSDKPPRSGRGGRRFKSCHSDQDLADASAARPKDLPKDLLPYWQPRAAVMVPHHARFWLKVRRSTRPGSCWEWQGALAAGYGRYKLKGRVVGAHRYAWEWVNGPVPSGLVVRHKCDNPKCCNPDHLDVGTYRDNVSDMVERGRAMWQR